MAAPQCISGRTSYLQVRLAFHLYPQVLPQFCNTGGCEPRRTFTSASLCSWIAHLVSGRIAATLVARPLQTRFPSGSPPLAEVNLQRAMHSPDHSTKGTPSALGSATEQWPLTAGKYEVSGSLSSPSRGAFHLSLTVLVHYRSLKVLSLGGWSPQLPTRFLVSRGTQDADPRQPLTATGLSPALVGRSNPFAFTLVDCCRSCNPICSEKQVVWAPPASLATTTGISVDFFSSGY